MTVNQAAAESTDSRQRRPPKEGCPGSIVVSFRDTPPPRVGADRALGDKALPFGISRVEGSSMRVLPPALVLTLWFFLLPCIIASSIPGSGKCVSVTSTVRVTGKLVD